MTAMPLCARPGFGFATRFTALDDDARARLARELDLETESRQVVSFHRYARLETATLLGSSKSLGFRITQRSRSLHEFRLGFGAAMTLTEVLERAAEMSAADRWAVYTQCGIHDFKVLMRTRTGGNPSPPYYCPVCLTRSLVRLVIGCGILRARTSHRPR